MYILLRGVLCACADDRVGNVSDWIAMVMCAAACCWYFGCRVKRAVWLGFIEGVDGGVVFGWDEGCFGGMGAEGSG